MSYFDLYLLLNLDNIKELFNNTYGVSVIIFCTLFIIIFIKTWGSDDKGVSGPFEKWDENNTKFLKKSVCIMIPIICFQITSNIVYRLTPSTGQVVAIIMAHEGLNSETFKTLKNLDPQIAEILDIKFDEYMVDATKKITNKVTK